LETRTQFKHRGNLGVHHDTPLGWLDYTSQNLEQSRFASAILANNTQGLAPNHVKVDVTEYLGAVGRFATEQQGDKCLQTFT
jgi:hypothetical protein